MKKILRRPQGPSTKGRHRAKTDEERKVDAEIGLRIAQVRTTMAHANMRTFAAEIGASAAAVSQWERGLGGITHYNLTRICDVYEISLEWLATGIGRPRRSYENRMNFLSPADQAEGYDLLDSLFDPWMRRRNTEREQN